MSASTRRFPSRWTSIRRTRRTAQRCRSARRSLGLDAAAWAWARVLGLCGEDMLAAPAPPSPSLCRTSRPERRSPSLPDCATQEASAAFVELFPALPASPTQCTIELSDPSGRKLTLSLRAAPGPDLVALTHSLWSRLR